jgi:hypothetical protein
MIGLVKSILLAAALASVPLSVRGNFALQAGRAKAQGHLTATQIGRSPLRQRLDLWLTDSAGKTLTRYAVDMTKRLHLILIGDDFTTFEHVHPTLGGGGHFSIVVDVPKPQVYYVYADSDPEGLGQQVFRYDLPIGRAVGTTRDLAPTGTSANVDSYRVTIGSTHLHAGAESELDVHITKAGVAAHDLRSYLGALAHAVFIDADDITYAHVHPMALGAGKSDAMSGMDISSAGGMSDMPGMSATPIPEGVATSPDMLLHVRVARAGVYKLWLQFRSTSGLHVAAFVLHAT